MGYAFFIILLHKHYKKQNYNNPVSCFLVKEQSINRKIEYERERGELYILYGRRRVGKTELLHAFCQDKPYIFFSVDTLKNFPTRSFPVSDLRPT